MSQIKREGEQIILDNGNCRIALLPERGGKVQSFRSLRTGREFFYSGVLRNTHHSGWDDCFPNIRPCPYPLHPFADQALPGFGMVWGARCESELEDRQVTLKLYFPSFRIGLERTYSLDDDNLFKASYRLFNHGTAPFHYIMDSHMLFVWEEGLDVMLPAGASRFYTYRCSHPDFYEPGTWISGPFWSDGCSGYNCKVFTPPLADGWARLAYGTGTAAAETLNIRFDSAALPYLGLWVAKAFTDENGGTTTCFSVQPTNFPSAALPSAEWAAASPHILPGDCKAWDITLQIR